MGEAAFPHRLGAGCTPTAQGRSQQAFLQMRFHRGGFPRAPHVCLQRAFACSCAGTDYTAKLASLAGKVNCLLMRSDKHSLEKTFLLLLLGVLLICLGFLLCVFYFYINHNPSPTKETRSPVPRSLFPYLTLRPHAVLSQNNLLATGRALRNGPGMPTAARPGPGLAQGARRPTVRRREALWSAAA